MKVHRVERSAPGTFPEFMFECPGCGCDHGFKTDGGTPQWEFNGDMDRPTVRPSLLVRAHRWEPSAEDPAICARIQSGEIVQTRVNSVCHSFVTDGQIQFLNDCTHALAGQTVPLPDMDA